MRIVNVTRTIALLTALVVAPALAEDTQQGDLDRQQAFKIEAQALDAALLDFSDQANVQVMVATATIEGMETQGVEGTYTPRSALAALLDDNDLKFTEVGNTVAVTSASDERGASDSKNLDPAPVLMAQNQTSQTPTTSSRSSEGGTSIVTGKVTDARTSANLKGAKITIEETGQWTSTNDLGEFRFVNVPTGSATLTVSYLGYAGQSTGISVYGDGTSQDFALRGGSEIEEIVVFGQRSARALALNQERTAENVTTVVSSDQLGIFAGTTLSESLRRVPGVTFQRDVSTGDGTNIVVRGLAPDLNAITLNGIELPEGSGSGRTASIGNILTESISQVTISKTLLPNQDSAGTGGLIEIETKSPLDRPAKYVSATMEAGRSGDSFNDDTLAAGTLSGHFGSNKNLGLGVSIQYRDRTIRQEGYSVNQQYGRYLPLQVDGTPSIGSLFAVSPELMFPFEPGVDGVYPTGLNLFSNETETTNISATISAAWEISEYTSLTADYQHIDQDNVATNRNSSVLAPAGYSPNPVPELGNETRQSLGWSGLVIGSSSYAYLPKREEKTDVLSLRGKTQRGRWQFDYMLGYAKGELRREQIQFSPFLLRFSDGSIESSDAIDPNLGRVVSLFPRRSGGQVPVPMLSDSGVAIFGDPSNYSVSQITQRRTGGENEKTTLGFDARFNFDSPRARYIEFGAFFEDSEFITIPTQTVQYFGIPGPGGQPTLAELGLSLEPSNIGGLDIGGIDVLIPQQRLESFFASSLQSISAPFDPDDPPTRPNLYDIRPFETNPLFARASTNESELAPYIQGRFDLGKFELIGGFRISRVKVEANNVTSPTLIDAMGNPDVAFAESNQVLRSESATQKDILPRLLVNLRLSADVVYRLGYFKSIARPQIGLLSDSSELRLDLRTGGGPNFDSRTFTVDKGNPNLKPAETENFDFSAEYYSQNIGVIKAGLFYKRIENLLETNITRGPGGLDGVQLPNDPRFQDVLANPSDYFIQVNLPVNAAGTSEIWGFEGAFERQFSGLPGFWSGLGLFLNYTYTDSEKDEVVTFFASPVLDDQGAVVGFEARDIKFPDVNFAGQSKHSGSVGVTYNRQGFDMSIAYTAQSKAKQPFFTPRGLQEYVGQFDTLDLRAEYFVEKPSSQYRFYLEIRDALNGTEDPTATVLVGGERGTPSSTISESFFGGRQFRLGATVSF